MKIRASGALAATATAAFAGIAATVVVGGFTGLDQWSVNHAMPWLSPVIRHQTVTSTLLPFRSGTPDLEIPAELWLYPASVPISAIIVAVGCSTLARQRRRGEAVLWASAWVAANFVEVIGKHFIDRPALTMLWHRHRVRYTGFDGSFPSGHSARAFLVAALITVLLRRAWITAASWAGTVIVLLVVANAHTPSDVAGGACLGATLIALIWRYPGGAPNADAHAHGVSRTVLRASADAAGSSSAARATRASTPSRRRAR